MRHGKNTILFSEVFPPPTEEANYLPWDAPIPTNQLLGVQFHAVPPDGPSVDTNTKAAFGFCISELKLLVDKSAKSK